ncbi:hypothetical protein E3N88_21784 [Mikania micrantha]|uniref:ARID domain-containing protein n=1 Tax=Mikania micrantha TaxID=192012 RepID=A0A5N6NA18_9ASTR|nr:hypothetical protein E3N88_21784 [Mikania micrantha]
MKNNQKVDSGKTHCERSNSDKIHVRRDDPGWKGKQKMHQGMRSSVIRILEQGFQKVDMVETSKGKARCLEQESVPVRTKFGDHIKPRNHFTKMVKWFYEEYFQQNTKEYPPTLPNGEPIDLFDLYMTVEGLGGRRVVAKESKRSEVGKELGLAESGPNLRIIYDGYLELLDRMYSMEKEKEPKIGEAPIEERNANRDGPSEKKEEEGVEFSPENNKEVTASSSQNKEKQFEDGESQTMNSTFKKNVRCKL